VMAPPAVLLFSSSPALTRRGPSRTHGVVALAPGAPTPRRCRSADPGGVPSRGHDAPGPPQALDVEVVQLACVRSTWSPLSRAPIIIPK
jgi:hypothetical protein